MLTGSKFVMKNRVYPFLKPTTGLGIPFSNPTPVLKVPVIEDPVMLTISLEPLSFVKKYRCVDSTMRAKDFIIINIMLSFKYLL